MSLIKKSQDLEAYLTNNKKFVRDQYLNKRINISELESGYYIITEDDKKIMNFFKDKDYSLLLAKIYKYIGFDFGFTEEARNACGYPVGKLHSDEIAKGRVFVVTERALNTITVKKDDSIKKTTWQIFNYHKQRFQVISLFANYVAKKKFITEIVVTSKLRSTQRQTEIVYDTVKERIDNPEKFKHISTSELRYSGNSGNHVIKRVAEGASRDTIVAELQKGIDNHLNGKTGEKLYFMGFNHVGDNDNTYDIGANSSRPTDSKEFRESFNTFKKQGIYITSQSMEESEENEPDCHHFVFR